MKSREERNKKSSRTEGESDESSDDEDDDVFASTNEASLDPDHRLLLKSALPLLQSRNTGVVMAVATLYHYLAPRMDQVKIAKSLIRILHTRKEAKFVILNGILTFVENNPDMFRPHLSDFFVESTEPVYIRKIKIDIVTLLANEGNISRILREFKIYVGQEDKDFVKATIQAIGRCAMLLPEVTETCMHCLTSLIGTHSEGAVAEAIVVIKKLLQVGQGGNLDSSTASSSGTRTPSSKHKHSNGSSTPDEKKKPKFADVIKHMAKLLDTVTNAQARASIAWIISEHVSQLKSIAPDVLRKLAKSFPSEDLLVKLQTLNLGVKLYLSNPEQTTLLFQYVLNLAKYDTSYDLRDRARLIRRIIFNAGAKADNLHEHAAQLFVTKKPVPSMDVITPTDSEGQYFFPGSISSLLGHTAYGYLRVPSWTTEAPASEARNPIRREWESYAYSGAGAGVAHTPAPITSISWNQVQNTQPAHATSFSSAGPGIPQQQPAMAAHSMAGFATREQYERDFWGDDSSSSSSGSRSRSGSTSSSSSGSSYSSSGSDSDTESETDDAPAPSADDDLFDTPAASQASSSAPAVAAAPSAPVAESAPVATENHEAPLVAEEPAVPVTAAEDFAPPTESNGDWLGDSNGESLI
jgi:AP-3 complex subunit beta